MNRFATLAAAFMLCVPVLGQSTFHATPLDDQQNSRLDKLEFLLDQLSDRLEDVQDCNQQRLSGLESDANAIVAGKPVPIVAPKPVVVAVVAKVVAAPVSSRYSTAELRAQIQQARPGGWQGPIYADVSPRSAAKRHLIGGEHGFSAEQVNGLSQDESLILHDLAPGHGSKIYPMRSSSTVVAAVVAKPVIASRQYVRGTVAREVLRTSGCANGQCAKSQSTSRSVQTSGRFRLFR